MSLSQFSVSCYQHEICFNGKKFGKISTGAAFFGQLALVMTGGSITLHLHLGCIRDPTIN